MKIEEIKKRLLDTNKDISYSQRVAIVDAIEMLEANKIELSKAIVDNYRRVELATEEELQDGGNHEKYCIYCGEENLLYKSYNHEEDCIVNKANKYIKEVKK